MPSARHVVPIDELLARLGGCLDSDGDRASAAAASRGEAARVAPQLPWIHRTGHARSPGWQAIFRNRRLAAGELKAECVERELGWDRVVFYFVASPALGKGSVVFIFRGLPPSLATFAPFDTGAVAGGHYIVPRDARPWDQANRLSALRDHIGDAASLDRFVAENLATHLRDPLDYVRRGQRSLPDFPTYHGLVSPEGDRRAWTVEVQVHTDVPLHPDHLACVAIEQNFEDIEIPDGLLDRVALFDPDVDDTFDAFVVRQVLAMIE